MTLPRVLVDIGLADPYVGNVFVLGDPVRGVLGSMPLGGDQWVTLDPSLIRSWRTRFGAGSADTPTLRYEAATATIVLNDPDRRFDPLNLAGPYVVAGESQIRPMVRVRIRAVWNGISYPLFYGYADDWTPSYQGNQWTYVTLTATDPSKVLADQDRAAGALIGAGETAGARIDWILNAAGIPISDRDIDTGGTTLQATTHAGNALGEIQLVQDTEQGQFYFDATGQAVFRTRPAIYTDPRSRVSQATFGDHSAGYSVSGELPYADVQPSTGDESLVNYVQISRAGGTEQVVQDVFSISKFLRKTHTRNDLLMQTDAEALAYARAVLYQHGRRAFRFARLEFNTPSPQVEAAHWPAVLGRRLADRITVKRRPYGGGSPIVRDCFVRGVEHESNGASWTSAFVLQDASRFSYFVVGDPVLGRLGLNALAY